MPKVYFIILVSVAAVLAGNLDAIYTIPNEEAVPYSKDVVVQPNPASSEDGGFIVGTIDTVGGTTYDWGANGPMNRMIVNSPGHGIHVLWMYSQSASGTSFPDRNMRYNYYDYAAGAWNWIDPDYMTSGVNVFTDRSGYGNLQADPATGSAIAGSHQGSGTLSAVFARDFEAGAGFFEYSTIPGGHVWPAAVVGQNGYIHVGALNDPGRASLDYIRSTTWDDWDSPVSLVGLTSAIQAPAASKVSDNVCMAWVPPAEAPGNGRYRISTDAGTTWGTEQILAPPPAFGGDTSAGFWIVGFSPFYDKFDKLHIVGSVTPYLGGTGYVAPAGIWHWCPDNSPAWTMVGLMSDADLQAAVGYNAVAACRPSLGEDANGGLYVVWEQFDPANVEPGPPERLRADIYYAQDNGDHGQTWQAPVKITDTDETTKRFPSIIDLLPGDTLVVRYIQDLKAGFFIQGENVATNNPIIVHKISTAGIGEGRRVPMVEVLSVRPNPFAGTAELSYTLPRASDVEFNVFDLAGREIARLCDRHQAAGQYSAVWNAADLTPGIYIARLKAGEKMLTQKLVLQ